MKNELKLVIPTLEYKEQVMEYRKKFLENNEKLSGCAELEDVSSYEEWIDFDNRRAKVYGKRLDFPAETLPNQPCPPHISASSARVHPYYQVTDNCCS